MTLPDGAPTCETCRYHSFYMGDRCGHERVVIPQRAPDGTAYVLGAELPVVEYARADGAACGPTGTLWEPKP